MEVIEIIGTLLTFGILGVVVGCLLVVGIVYVHRAIRKGQYTKAGWKYR